MAEVLVEGVRRSFHSFDRRRGLWGAVLDLARRDGTTKVAVQELSFSLAAGEAVALIGPNGAGKSTTVKLLAGILKPDAGRVVVGGLDPWRDRKQHVARVGAVFGQRTQLWWDLAVIEALDLLAALYGVPAAVAAERVRRFDAVLGIGPLLRTPVRQLSLGERMRCELAAALLHDPPLLFLDEPTVGLDVAVKQRLRAFLTDLIAGGRTTVLLTTHDLAEVSALCPRVLLLAQGRLLHDGPLDALARALGGRRVLTVQLREPIADEALAGLPPWTRIDAFTLQFQVEQAAPALVAAVLQRCAVADLRLDDPPVEALVARFYQEGR